MPRRTQITVIGAGLAGLAAAYRLRRAGGARVLEREPTVGGLCDTVVDQGYRFDRTGHLLHFRDRRLRRTVLSLLDEEPHRIDRRSRIFSHGVHTHFPFQANTYGLPREVITACLTGFVEARERRAAGQREPRTFEEFILAHFGKGIAEQFMIPYNHKLWGVHPREITAEWCDRFVPVPRTEDVIRGALGPPERQLGYNASFDYPKRGIGELPAALARRVRGIELNTSPEAVDHRRRRILAGGEWQGYSALISTIPLPSLVALLVDPPKSVVKAAGELRCTGLRYLDVALNRPVGNDHHWAYVPERRYPFYRVGCYSNFSASMAPRGKANLYVELAARGPLRMRSLLPRVAAGLTEMGLIRSAGDIAFARARHLRHAYVVYDGARTAAVGRLHGWLERQHILTAGRYARWEYSAMEDALAQGFAAADAARELA